jgi:hypothetical protein
MQVGSGDPPGLTREAQRGALQPLVAGPVEEFDDVRFTRGRRSFAQSAISARDL